MYYLELLITGIMDTLEELFDSISKPTSKHTIYAFVISLGFLIISIVCTITGKFAYLSIPEAITCSVLLAIVALVDGTTRASTLNGIKSFYSNVQRRFASVDNSIDEESNEDMYTSTGDTLHYDTEDNDYN